MKIVLVTYGTRGDVQPMLALALGLQSKGHEVLFVAPPENEAWVKSFGCRFRPVGGNMLHYFADLKRKDIPNWMMGLRQHWLKEIDAQFKVLPQMVADADLILSSSLIFALHSIAEVKKIPYRCILLCPQWLRSVYYPVPCVGMQSFPKLFNYLSWEFAKTCDRLYLLGDLNQYRKRLGLKPIQDSLKYIFGRHVIVATDPAISQIAPDVADAQVYQTGYMHLKEPPPPTDPELEAFLNAGPPPVYVGFGSLSKDDQNKIATTIIRAVRAAGQRVVMRKCWDETSENDLYSDDVFLIGNYPHLSLFPRMAAVIHHGGTGTTATAAFSGVPQIVVPYFLDQYYWGYQIYRSGLGPASLWRLLLAPRLLARAVKQGLYSQTIRQKAKDAAQQIQATDAIENTINTIFNTLD